VPRRVKNLTPFTDTTLAVTDRMDRRFTPDWDKEPAAAQQMVRMDERAKMRAKKVPTGAGVTRRV
jgi:hypothetical protein